MKSCYIVVCILLFAHPSLPAQGITNYDLLTGAMRTHLLAPPPDSVWHKWKSESDSTFYIEINSMEEFNTYLGNYKGYDNQKPQIDFSRQVLIGTVVCWQCLEVCKHEYSCHRNACMYDFAWATRPRQAARPIAFKYTRFLKQNEKDTSKTPVVENDHKGPLVIPDSKSAYIIVQQYGGGDCHARFSHSFTRNDETKTIEWTVYNTYGGCRAGLYKEFAFKIENPGPGYTMVFKTKQVDERVNPIR